MSSTKTATLLEPAFAFFLLCVLSFVCCVSLSFLPVRLLCLSPGITGVACAQTHYRETLRRTAGVLDLSVIVRKGVVEQHGVGGKVAQRWSLFLSLAIVDYGGQENRSTLFHIQHFS